MRQETTTVVARVTDATGLRAALDELAKVRVGGTDAPALFADPDLGIHFARVVLLDGGEGGGGQDERRFSDELVLESNFDTTDADEEGAGKAHLLRLAGKKSAELASLFRHCEGFRSSTPEGVAAYMTKRVNASTARYQGHTYRSLDRIRLERNVRETLIGFLETTPKAPPPELFARLRAHVRERARTDPALAGLDLSSPAPAVPDPAVRSRALAQKVEPWIENSYLLAPVLLRAPQIAFWEHTDVPFDHQKWQENWTEKDFERFHAVARSEDHGIQNALTHVVPVRGGFDRAGLLRHLHCYIARLAKTHFNDIGELGGIPSIHFAQWMLLTGLEGERLVFMSNYDNSWESYLGDFVDQAAIGLNLAWACTEYFPKTQLLGFGGANDEERFKAWTRAYQKPTQLFYSAYPDLGIAAINNNTWIRHGLHGDGPPDLDVWFRRLS